MQRISRKAARKQRDFTANRRTPVGFRWRQGGQPRTLPLPAMPANIQSLMNPALALPSPAALPQSSGPFMSQSEQERWNVDAPSLDAADRFGLVKISK